MPNDACNMSFNNSLSKFTCKTLNFNANSCFRATGRNKCVCVCFSSTVILNNAFVDLVLYKIKDTETKVV